MALWRSLSRPDWSLTVHHAWSQRGVYGFSRGRDRFSTVEGGGVKTDTHVSAVTLRQGSENNPYIVLKILFLNTDLHCVKVKPAGCLGILLMNGPVRCSWWSICKKECEVTFLRNEGKYEFQSECGCLAILKATPFSIWSSHEDRKELWARGPIPELKRRTIYWGKKKKKKEVGRGLEKIRCTWGPARPRTARWIRRSFRSAGCSGRARGGGWERPGPSGCCRPSAAPCRWCNRWRGCRSYQLFLERQARSPVSHSRGQNPTGL